MPISYKSSGSAFKRVPKKPSKKPSNKSIKQKTQDKGKGKAKEQFEYTNLTPGRTSFCCPQNLGWVRVGWCTCKTILRIIRCVI